jgi:hypothetical protein
MSITHESSHPGERPVNVKRFIASVAIAGAAVAGLASAALATPGSNIVGTIIARAGARSSHPPLLALPQLGDAATNSTSLVGSTAAVILLSLAILI